MANNVAVVAVHGMGEFRPPVQGKKARQYSAPLAGLVKSMLGASAYQASVHWKETYYDDILAKNQKALMKTMARLKDRAWLRGTVVENLGDPASYASRWDDPKNLVYRNVHDRLNATIAATLAEAGPGAPLVILAHSLGAKVVSNHIWDHQGGTLPAAYVTPDRIARFITFGCNLPLFTFAFDVKDIKTFKDPGTGLPAKFRGKPWWFNCNDRDDPLGFPLIPCGKGYADLGAAGGLKDLDIRAAGFWAFTPASHTGYWHARDLARVVATEIKALINA